MLKDGIFEFDGVTASNIKKLSERQSLIFEQRIIEIYELACDAADFAVSMFFEGYGIYEILSMISDGISDFPKVNTENTLPEILSLVCHRMKYSEVSDKAAFSSFLLKKILETGVNISEESFLPVESVPETFTYVKNALSDEAYDVFAQEFDNPTVKYSKSFGEAARATSKGEVGYCLLPLEEKGGARLSAVAALLFKEDLKINGVIPVFGFEGTADMKYALVSRHFSFSKHNTDDDRYLEIRMSVDSSIPLSELFAASESMGYKIYRINTISFETDEGTEPHYSVVFKDESGDFTKLLIFLTMFSGAYTPVGIYKNLE